MSNFEENLSEGVNMVFQTNYLVCIGIFFLLLWILCIKQKLLKPRNWEINEAEFGIGNQKIKLKANNYDTQIAYKIWVELSTRKIGIKIDPEKDVIDEVYNSWYQFFRVTRELIKDIPASKIKREATKEIITLSVDILNKAMRPHLTQWQAIFRKWYNQELKKGHDNLSPQQIQGKFPKYEELIVDLLKVNGYLIKYCESMENLAFGND